MEVIRLGTNNVKISLSADELERYGLEYPDTEGDYCHVARYTVKRILAAVKKETGVDYCGERLFIRMFRSRDGGCELFISRTEEKDEKGERVENSGGRVVCFPSANALISACRAMVGCESDAYIGDKEAYLILPQGSEAELAVAEEFGKTVDFLGAEEYVKEHCDLLVKGNAVEVIGRL